MAETINGVSFGCTAALEDRAYGVARAGRSLARILTNGGTLPSVYVIAGEVFNVAKINVTPNGTTDNQTALASALIASRGGTPTLLVLPPSNNYYRYSNELPVSTNTYIVGYGAKIKPLGNENMRFDLLSNSGIFGIVMHAMPGAISKWPERFEAANKLVEGDKDGTAADAAGGGTSPDAWVTMFAVANCIMFDVDTTGSFEGALRCANSDNVLIENCSSFRSHSDSFHLFKEARNITVRKCYCYDSGDDAISIVQYDTATGIPRNMLIEGNVVKGGRARGLTVISGQDILYRKNIVEDINLAGYRFGPTGAFSLNDTQRIIVQDCEAWRCGRMQATSNNSGSFAALLSTSTLKCLDVSFTNCRGYSYGTDFYKSSAFVRETNSFGAGGLTFTADANCVSVPLNSAE